jgi:hypothetical protein
MYYHLIDFRDDENGAVTVDWVVLTAAAVGLTVLISTTMSGYVLSATDGLAAYMSDWSFD